MDHFGKGSIVIGIPPQPSGSASAEPDIQTIVGSTERVYGVVHVADHLTLVLPQGSRYLDQAKSYMKVCCCLKFHILDLVAFLDN